MTHLVSRSRACQLAWVEVSELKKTGENRFLDFDQNFEGFPKKVGSGL